MSNEQRTDIHTTSVHGAGPDPRSVSFPSVQPIYQTAVFDFPDPDLLDAVQDDPSTGYLYGRNALPNHVTLERLAAELEGGSAGLACASGMAAIAVVLLAELRAGAHLVATKDLYGGTYALVTRDLERFGVATTFVAATDTAALRAALRPDTRVVLVETISNPRMRLVDVEALAGAAHDVGALLVVDNTFATPYHCRPLALGADVVVHSATKYIGGHHDLTAGLVIGSAEVVERARAVGIRVGTVLGPHDAWLATRGAKTLALRMERIAANAQVIAERLAEHPKVQDVHYPGLPTHPQHELAKRMLVRGFGGMLSFEVRGGLDGAFAFLRGLRLITLTPSLGGVATTVSHPGKTSHRSLTADERELLGISDGLIRLSVGIEQVEDIWQDLADALDRVK